MRRDKLPLWIACAVLGLAMAGATIAITLPSGQKDRPVGTTSTVHRGVLEWRSPFALTFESVVNAYAVEHHKEKIKAVSCVQGAYPPAPVQTYRCAFTLAHACRLADIDYRDGQVDVVKVGRIPLPPGCTIRQVFRWASGKA